MERLVRPKVVMVMTHDVAREQFGEAELARLRAVADLDDPTPLEELDSPQARRRLATADALVTSWGCPRLDGDRLDAAPRLRAVFHSAGSVRELVSPELWSRQILVTNAADENADPVAAFVVATIVLMGKRAPFLAQAARTFRDDWSYQQMHGDLGNDRTIGLVGFSRVGRRVTEQLVSHGLRTLVYDPLVDAEEIARAGALSIGLEELLSASDIVSLHAPALPSTQGMIGRAQLGQMRDGATLLNTARGSLVDTTALEVECGSGRLYAILDVTEPEPLPRSSPLYELPNVLITPHVAGSLGHETRRMSARALTELERYVAGLPPEQAVTADGLVISA